MPAIYRNNVRYGNTSSIAQNVTYDNTDSNLAAENTQDAIDEVNSKFDNMVLGEHEYTGSVQWINATKCRLYIPFFSHINVDELDIQVNSCSVYDGVTNNISVSSYTLKTKKQDYLMVEMATANQTAGSVGRGIIKCTISKLN